MASVKISRGRWTSKNLLDGKVVAHTGNSKYLNGGGVRRGGNDVRLMAQGLSVSSEMSQSMSYNILSVLRPERMELWAVESG